MANELDSDSLLARVGGRWAGYELQPTFRREVADLLQRKAITFPGAQPVSFAAKHIEELKSQDYFVCEKTDGMRYLMYMTQDEDPSRDIHYLIDRKNDYYFVGGLHFPHHDDKTFRRFHTGTILDGELVEDRYPDGRPSVIKYLVFDCLVLDGTVLTGRSLDKRLGYFKAYVLTPYRAWLKENPQIQLPFKVEDKTVEFSYGLEKMFKEIIPRVKQLHGNDGLIFTCRNTPYKTGTDEHILKWKPPNENTIDFLLHIVWAQIEPDPSDPDQSLQDDYDAFPADLGLYVYYGNDSEYARHSTLYVTTQEWEGIKALNRPLQDAIIECYLEKPDDPTSDITSNGAPAHSSNDTNGGSTFECRWRFHRFRDDKENANHVTTYNSVIDSIQDHVTEEDLLRHAGEIRSAWKTREAEARRVAPAR